MLTLGIIKVRMHLPLVGQGDRHPRAKLGTRTRQVVVEHIVVDLHFVVRRELMCDCRTQVRLGDGPIIEREVAPDRGTRLGNQRTHAIAISVHAVIQGVLLALNLHCRQLRERLDEVVVSQFDVATELSGCAHPPVVIVALGAAAITEIDLGLIAELVNLERDVSVVTGRTVDQVRYGPK